MFHAVSVSLAPNRIFNKSVGDIPCLTHTDITSVKSPCGQGIVVDVWLNTIHTPDQWVIVMSEDDSASRSSFFHSRGGEFLLLDQLAASLGGRQAIGCPRLNEAQATKKTPPPLFPLTQGYLAEWEPVHWPER